MGQKDGVLEERRSQKWTAAVDLQPTLPKSDRLLGPNNFIALMTLIRAYLLLFVLLLTPCWVSAKAHFIEDQTPGLLAALPNQQPWLFDPTGALTLDAVRRADKAGQFAQAPPSIMRGNGTQAHWFRVQLNQRTASGDWVLATQTTALKDVQFYGPFDDSLDASSQALAPPIHTGLSQPFATRPLASERYVMRLQLAKPGTYTVYARLVSETAPILGLSVWDTAQYLQWRQDKRLFDGICYGILLALLVYNLVLALTFRDATYAYYVVQCSFALLTLASFNGHAAHYLWGAWPWWQEHGNVILPALWITASLLFARSFLDTRLLRWLDRALLATAMVSGASVVLSLGGQLLAAQALMEAVALGGTLLATVCAVIMIRKGYTPARWYLAGQAALFTSALGMVLVNWKVINAPFMLANGLQIGVSAEMVVFALALSTRIQRLRTSQLTLQIQSEHLATEAATDPLTGLANRTGLARGGARLQAEGASCSVMLLDLDKFKPINDALGHDAGDAVLRAVAQRLQAQMRAGDLVARLGGDEFVILLAGPLPEAQLAALAERLRAQVREPVEFQGHRLTVGVSIGIARCPSDGSNLTDLIRYADQAMYGAKQTQSGYMFHRTAG